MTDQTLEQAVRGALARAYCAPKNTSKELDSALLEAAEDEIVQLIVEREAPKLGPRHSIAAMVDALLDALDERLNGVSNKTKCRDRLVDLLASL